MRKDVDRQWCTNVICVVQKIRHSHNKRKPNELANHGTLETMWLNKCCKAAQKVCIPFPEKLVEAPNA